MRRAFGLTVTDLVIGLGTVAARGSKVAVEWRGCLNRGDEFGRGSASFCVGKREVIAGIDRGVIGMKVGGVRKIRVSPHLAYRDKGAPGIPPNAVLEFEIKLVGVSTDA